jgi:hypothetical protein
MYLFLQIHIYPHRTSNKSSHNNKYIQYQDVTIFLHQINILIIYSINIYLKINLQNIFHKLIMDFLWFNLWDRLLN